MDNHNIDNHMDNRNPREQYLEERRRWFNELRERLRGVHHRHDHGYGHGHDHGGHAHTHVHWHGENYWLDVRKGYDDDESKVAYDFTFGNLRNPKQHGTKRVHDMDDTSLDMVLTAAVAHENMSFVRWRRELDAVHGETGQAQMTLKFGDGTKYGLGVKRTTAKEFVGYDEVRDVPAYAFTYWNEADKRLQSTKTVKEMDDVSLSAVLMDVLRYSDNWKSAVQDDKFYARRAGAEGKIRTAPLEYQGVKYARNRREADADRRQEDRRRARIAVDLEARKAESDRRAGVPDRRVG